MSDNYEFEKSSQPQEIDDYSPYVDKQYNGFINDLNGGIYTNTSLSLVQFDLGQIYNSQKFTDTNDMFCVIPIVMVAAFSTANNAALVAPTAAVGAVNLLSIKTNFMHLIHQADLQINGKTIESTQPFINVVKHFQMLSEMSVNDLATIGYTQGFGESVDNYRSAVFNNAAAATASCSGNGFTNNKVVAPNGSRVGSTITSVQHSTAVNDAITSKLGRYVDLTNPTANKLVTNIYTQGNLEAELKPTFRVSGNYMIWNDYAVIKLSNLFESLGNIGLVRKFDCTLRLWLNTGTVNATVINPNATNLGYSLANTDNTFTNSCPLMINYLNDTAANGGIPATALKITAGLYVASSPNVTFGAVNFNNFSSSLRTCRIYYSQIQVENQKALAYVEQNRNKKVVYRTVLTNQFNNLNAGGSFNQLINSGVVHPVGILIVPYISSTVAAGFGDYQWKSPFDSCPATSSPVSLINLQVSVGGVNQLQSTLGYTYENFIEQINLAESLTSSDFGVSCGLFNQAYWEMFRHYYINIERANISDKNMARNINISFQNNSQVAIDVLTFIIYSDTFVIDVESGIVKK